MINWKQVLDFADKGNLKPPKRVEKTEEEWKQILDDSTFRVTRKHGTERPFTGEYCESFEPGTYACRCCGSVLFSGDTKFESGTGWPSFTTPAAENAIKYVVDRSFGMVRVETLCNVCDAHLGHVFPDGPAPTGLRYCMNSVALQKIEE
ncbi:MAG: peptide-methionine (R)-S-oxide reductase MsrB [Balneolales bacterium]|nr:peptide-methionine (R)-S-oxide reductase MsrB [Balneolales bacterium]